MRQIAARMRAERLASGLSQEEAASRAQLGYKHWQEIEGARANPTLETLVRIAKALDVELWDIVRKSAAPGKRRQRGT
jgi:transcriptional regulator with XRE-family HTH domain